MFGDALAVLGMVFTDSSFECSFGVVEEFVEAFGAIDGSSDVGGPLVTSVDVFVTSVEVFTSAQGSVKFVKSVASFVGSSITFIETFVSFVDGSAVFAETFACFVSGWISLVETAVFSVEIFVYSNEARLCSRDASVPAPGDNVISTAFDCAFVVL